MILEKKDLKNIKEATNSLKKVLKTMTDICNTRNLCYDLELTDVCPFYDNGICKKSYLDDITDTMKTILREYK